jgi:hypothetical protein
MLQGVLKYGRLNAGKTLGGHLTKVCFCARFGLQGAVPLQRCALGILSLMACDGLPAFGKLAGVHWRTFSSFEKLLRAEIKEIDDLPGVEKAF